jgi:hypothetical protein
MGASHEKIYGSGSWLPARAPVLEMTEMTSKDQETAAQATGSGDLGGKQLRTVVTRN